MGMEDERLSFLWMQCEVVLKVDEDRCNMLDLVIEFEDEDKKSGAKLDYKYLEFSYVYNMKHVKLLNDNDLMKMFSRLSKKKVIDIYVGVQDNPNPLYEFVLRLREQNNEEVGNMVDNHVDDMLENENEGVDSDEDSEYIPGESEYGEENVYSEESDDDEASVHSAGSDHDDDSMLFDRNNNGEEIVGKYGRGGNKIIIFEEDKYASDDNDRVLLEEIEEGGG
ncbi:uncharacterized protein LOC141673155 [Apium graveolens]|uniref:uncharacterized protein LOC141673155 n=1 Tax=Apium graveolens TaxID=4045 RepID=UPI003D78F6AB